MESSWRPQRCSVTTGQWFEDTLDGSDSSVLVSLLSVCHHMLLHSHSCLVVLEPCQHLHLWLGRGFSVSAQPFPNRSHEACVPLLFHYLYCFFTHTHTRARIRVCVVVDMWAFAAAFWFFSKGVLPSPPFYPNFSLLQHFRQHHSAPPSAFGWVQLWHACLWYALAWPRSRGNRWKEWERQRK